MKDLAVGMLVAPAPAYRETMGTGEGAAVLIGILRGSGKLYYAATDRAFWVPLRRVRAIPPEVVPAGSLESLLSRWVSFLGAYECSVARREKDTVSLELEVPVLARGRIEQLSAELGERLIEWTVEPASMHAVRLKLELGSLPPPEAARDRGGDGTACA